MVHDLIDLSCIRHSPVQAEIVKRHTAGEIPRAEVVLDSLGRRCLYFSLVIFFFSLGHASGCAGDDVRVARGGSFAAHDFGRCECGVRLLQWITEFSWWLFFLCGGASSD